MLSRSIDRLRMTCVSYFHGTLLSQTDAVEAAVPSIIGESLADPDYVAMVSSAYQCFASCERPNSPCRRRGMRFSFSALRHEIMNEDTTFDSILSRGSARYSSGRNTGTPRDNVLVNVV